jgi:D-beta-D-heptose 7-phosphate kinase/D-beta-D-heptose 1-phosphate adenosyltransferase
VGLNSDSSVRGLKGDGRPILSQDERSTILAGLAAVDYVVPFDEPTPLRLIERVRPDVLVKGEDYKESEVVGRPLVEAAGGRVVLAPLWPGVSTTSIIERIRTKTTQEA